MDKGAQKVTADPIHVDLDKRLYEAVRAVRINDDGERLIDEAIDNIVAAVKKALSTYYASAGLKVLPREPTDDMWGCAEGVVMYRAMWDAAGGDK